MSYRIIDNVSILIQRPNEELEEYIIDNSLSIDTITAYTKLYERGAISKKEYLCKVNPGVGEALYKKNLEEKEKYYASIQHKRKNRRLHDVLDIIELDEEDNAYLTGHNWKIPQSIVDRLLDAKFNPRSNYTVDSLLLFLKQLMLCPNKNVRDNAINYIDRNGMFITPNGMLLTFRRVNEERATYDGQIESIYNKIRAWKKGPKNYTLFQNKENDIVYRRDAEKELFVEENGDTYNNIGNLETLYNNMENVETNKYIPSHHDNTTFFIDGKEQKGSPYYQLGTETRLPREYCDESNNTCSRGLHTWSKLDHRSYTSFGSKILAVLISPIDFVSCPYGDNSKMRSAAIFPIAELEEKDLDIFDESCIGNIEHDYFNYTVDYIQEQFLLNKEDRSVKFNPEIDAAEVRKTLKDVKDVLVSRVVKV